MLQKLYGGKDCLLPKVLENLKNKKVSKDIYNELNLVSASVYANIFKT